MLGTRFQREKNDEEDDTKTISSKADLKNGAVLAGDEKTNVQLYYDIFFAEFYPHSICAGKTERHRERNPLTRNTKSSHDNVPWYMSAPSGNQNVPLKKKIENGRFGQGLRSSPKNKKSTYGFSTRTILSKNN